VVKDFADGAEMPWADLYVPEACYSGPGLGRPADRVA